MIDAAATGVTTSGQREIGHTHTIDPPVRPRLLERDRAGNGQQVDSWHVADNRERTRDYLTRVELAADAERQLTEGAQDSLGNQDVNILGGPHRPVQVGRNPSVSK